MSACTLSPSSCIPQRRARRHMSKLTHAAEPALEIVQIANEASFHLWLAFAKKFLRKSGDVMHRRWTKELLHQRTWPRAQRGSMQPSWEEDDCRPSSCPSAEPVWAKTNKNYQGKKIVLCKISAFVFRYDLHKNGHFEEVTTQNSCDRLEISWWLVWDLMIFTPRCGRIIMRSSYELQGSFRGH